MSDFLIKTTKEFPVFKAVFNIYFVSDVSLFEKDVAIKYEPGKENALGFFSMILGVPYLVFKCENLSVGTVAHESWHAVRNMLFTVGAELDNETVAYHLGFLVNEIWNYWQENKSLWEEQEHKDKEISKSFSKLFFDALEKRETFEDGAGI